MEKEVRLVYNAFSIFSILKKKIVKSLKMFEIIKRKFKTSERKILKRKNAEISLFIVIKKKVIFKILQKSGVKS